MDRRSTAEKSMFDQQIADLSQKDWSQYARAIVDCNELMEKVADHKRSTVRAFAEGTCDMPLCDQVCFYFVWLQEKMPEALDTDSESEWWLDRSSGFTSVGSRPSEKAVSLNVAAMQPRMANPNDEAVLRAIVAASEELLIAHLASMSSLDHGGEGRNSLPKGS